MLKEHSKGSDMGFFGFFVVTAVQGNGKSGPEVITVFSCSTQQMLKETILLKKKDCSCFKNL